MPATPAWARRNRIVAWTSYVCVLLGFATLAVALTAAGSGDIRWAMIAGGACAAITIVGITLLATTVHRDHVDHHAGPRLLNDEWDQVSEPRARRIEAAQRAGYRTWPGM
jgi:hypothetical protein